MPAPTVDLGNTPGFYYALGYGLGALLFIHLTPLAPQRARRMWGFSGLWLAMMAFMSATYHIPKALFIPCIALVVAMIYGMFRLSCAMDARRCMYYTVRAFVVGEFAASIEWQLFYYGLTAMGLPLNMGVNLVFLVVTHGVVFTVLWALESRFREDNRGLMISRKELVTAVLVAATVFAVSNLSYVIKDTPFTSVHTAEIFAIRTAVDLGGIAILFGYHMTLVEVSKRMEIEALNGMLDRQYAHYLLAKDTVELVNQKYHDMKHLIHFMRSDAPEREKQAYLDELSGEISRYEVQNQTGSPVVDTILTEKRLLCRQRDIQLNVVADGTALDFMSTMELCSLLGNALENAIEAAEKVEADDQRLILFSLDRRKGFACLRVENRCAEAPMVRDSVQQTTKADKALHGFGLRSMAGIVEKYGGSMKTSFEDGWYRLRVLIPCDNGGRTD